VEIFEVGKKPNLSMGFDGRFDHGQKVLIVGIVEFAGHLESKRLSGALRQLSNHVEFNEVASSGAC
jgi:hypothetical protein